MAIAFARLEFVKRSSGKNAVGKAAYNSRSQLEFHGSSWQEPRNFDWSHKPQSAYHEILLPETADPKFKNPETLWNAAESKENRRNSQSAIELVLAPPDDKIISLEDKKHLARTFVETHFIQKGLAAQIDIHQPETKQNSSQENPSETPDHNWHAHVLITTRRFKENGHEFEDNKARDLMPNVKGGRVITGEHWGKLWAHHQNTYFEQKGLSLRVDAEGVIPQKHLGPVRMRARAFSLLDEHEIRLSLNALESEDPTKVLEKITQTKNIFTAEDVNQFLHKHVHPDKVLQVKETFWKQTTLIQLLDPKTQRPLNQFTTQAIIEEERKILLLADRLISQNGHPINLTKTDPFSMYLNLEQKNAYHHILTGKRLACIEGYAGTGKTALITALKNTYESQGYTVRGLGADSAAAQVLKEKGFSSSENIYRFLFSLYADKNQITKNEVWILDEAGKLGTRPLLELLKQANRLGAQLILSGDSAQFPPIERGIGLKLFSEKYGAYHLENIQRQQEESQRAIARKLAKGEMGQALDAILKNGTFKWTATKEEAIEQLIQSWTQHRNTSTLILANSNRELRALNELVRLYRKQVGELPHTEYQCETVYGKIYISVGDKIEFRKNDKELNINNGTTGILIQASEKKFTVQIDKNKVSFDPRQYPHFQLGYATTYYRSQGRAADRVFVLYSPQMNKEAFYVDLTRHYKTVECFISNQDAKNLSDVKRQIYRQTPKASTLEYLTHNDLERQHTQTLKQQQIETLKSSDSLLSQAKGITLSTWEEIRTRTSKTIERYKDKKPDPAFFNPTFEKHTSGRVQEVKFQEEIKLDPQKINVTAPKQEIEIQPPKTSKSNHWHKLPEVKQKILKEYFKAAEICSSLHTIVKSEEEVSGNSSHFQELQKACGERNAQAYELIKALKSRELRFIFESKTLDILQERAAKHEMHLIRQENSLSDLDAKLKENLEPLLYRLFPEGPTKRDSKSLRFGTKRSLSVAFKGEKIGSFYDFERGEGGGPLQLIQRTLSCTPAESIHWAKDFLNQAPTPIPKQFLVKQEKEQEWHSLKPPHDQAPSLTELSKHLSNHYKETARYAYRDTNGEILFYTLRLEDKIGKKIILPLSYGYFNGNESNPSWSLKGYQTEKKPLYNLPLLQAFPHAKILIVEGEKTADAASKMFPTEKMICLTWSGGASAISKSDWQPLFMRDIIIWPDNDKAGFDASEAICNELRKVGIKSLHEVQKEILSKELPPKWDLADPLPQDKSNSFVKDMLLRAHEKAVGLNVLFSHLKANALQVDIHVAKEVLAQVEEKMRPALEQQFGSKKGEIRSALLEETVCFLKDPNRQNILSNFGEGMHKDKPVLDLLQERENSNVSIDKKGLDLGR